MNTSLTESYRLCQTVARDAASSFYAAFYLLPQTQRQAMFALYAYLRRTDDLGDSEEPAALRRERLLAWRESLTAALQGEFHDPLLPALADTLQRFKIPPQYLFEVIAGVEQDLSLVEFETFSELRAYCYRVASVVGMACVHIWGFHGEQALPLAESCGLAFQLTNILRDLKEDAARDRIYLPLEDLARFDYSPADLQAGVCDERFRRLIAWEIRRAAEAYSAATPLLDCLTRDGRRVFSALCATYMRLLRKIDADPQAVWEERIKLTWWEKARIVSLSAAAPTWCVQADVGAQSRYLARLATVRAETP